MNNVIKVLSLAATLCILPCMAWANEPRSLDWFRDPQNKTALEEMLQQCNRMSEVERKADEECDNARLAHCCPAKW